MHMRRKPPFKLSHSPKISPLVIMSKAMTPWPTFHNFDRFYWHIYNYKWEMGYTLYNDKFFV